VSAVIDPRGEVVSALPQFKAAVLEATVVGHTGSTPYARVGNYFVVTLLLVALLAVSVPQFLRSRR
jgi:apolipoprotein N-acyltransferase